MLPNTLLLRNFRSFAGPEFHRIELRPLTLLFGQNNSGKSAIVRALPLLADSMGYDGLVALNLGGRLKPFDIDFDTLRWKGREETDERTIGLGLGWDSAAPFREMTWALWEESDWRRIVVERFVAIEQPGEPVLTTDWRLTRGEQSQEKLTYDLRLNAGEPQQRKILWSGLLPKRIPWPASFPKSHELDIQSVLETFNGAVLWLHSLRPAPDRYIDWRGPVRWSLAPDGSDTSIVLAGEPEVRAEVASWYERHLGIELIIDEARKREVRTLLRSRSRVSFDVDLIDSGEGLSECLPVLTALAMARHHNSRKGPGIVAIEEPGSHLHPDLQRALIERACEVAAIDEPKPRIVLETHSEHALLAARLQVVKGLLSPQDVIIYWVRRLEDGRSVAERVEIDAEGRFRGDWPPDVFQQDIQLAAEIQDARDARDSRQP